jgi:oligogalacturonide lyase
MKFLPSLVPVCLGILLASRLAADPVASAPPKAWIDPDTGHRVIRLTDQPGSASLYFNDCAYTPNGKELVYTTTADFGCSVVDLTTFQNRVVVPGPVRTICMGRKTPTVFYVRTKGDVQDLYSTNVDTGETKHLATLPGPGPLYTVNADETLAAGTYVPGHPPSFGGRAGLPFPHTPQVDPLEQDPKKGTLMIDRFSARLPIVLYVIDLATGQSRTLFTSNDWINHAQFSPVDPSLLMYCHEGPWQWVDRIWTIRTDGSHNHLVHHRTMQMEIAGHEWWSADGQNVWYQLHYPAAMRMNFLASENVVTGERQRFAYPAEAASIHHATSPDGTLFCGDGDTSNPWIVLCHPVRVVDQRTLGTDLIRPGTVTTERLVNMSRHQYRLEPNPIFTLDQKMIVFRSNLFGPTYVFGVEVAKAGSP